jgi:hypothetical protein
MFNKVIMAVIAATATNAISLNKAPQAYENGVPVAGHGMAPKDQFPAGHGMAPKDPAGESTKPAGQEKAPKLNKGIKDFLKKHDVALAAAVK